MDETLEVVDLAADLGLEGAVTWLLRVVGLLLILGGIGVFLLTEITWLVPVGMVVVGLVLLVAPTVLLFLAEFA
jgi:Na+-translocating ferredoxin:NAD+ oxidoreductase RnfD subunit